MMITKSETGALARLDETGVPMLIARLLVGGVMIYMSISKMQAPIEFLKVIRLYDMLPGEWYVLMNLIAVVIPWIELLGGAALILGIGLRGTAAVMILMLVVFTTAIAWRTIGMVQAGQGFFGVKFDCGCGGGPTIIWIKLLENGGLILASMLIFLSRSRRFCLSSALKSTSVQPQAV